MFCHEMWPQECQPSETENRLMPFNMLPLTFSHEKYPNIQTRDSTKFFIISFLCPIICQRKIYKKNPKKHCFLLHCWFLLSLLFLFLLVLNYFRHVPHFPMFLISCLRIISDTNTELFLTPLVPRFPMSGNKSPVACLVSTSFNLNNSLSAKFIQLQSF